MNKYKKFIKPAIVGLAVVIVTPMVTMVPPIFDLKIITVGAALVAAATAIVADLAVDYFIK